MRKLFGLLIFALLAGAAAPATAQIYTWRDNNGRLVLSDTPRDGQARVYAVPEASEPIRATRAVSVDRTRPYEDLIVENARRNNVRPDLVRAVVQVESAFNPQARSPKGAMGLMQLMPATVAQFGVANAYDPSENLRAGTAYLRRLLDRYDGNEELALAAYNAGPTAVDRHDGVPPYLETRRYVEKVGGLAGESHLPAGTAIYRTVEIVNGRPVTRYSDKKPTDGPYETLGR